MGFWNGRVSYTRYRVGGKSPLPLGDEILEKSRAHLIGRHGAADQPDGIATGWAGGEHVLDLSIELGKNIVDDALHLAIRVDTDKIPGVLLRAYTQIEIEARAQLNESGVVTKSQRKEAKEAALERAQAEAADGRFRRLNHFPVLWDARSQVLYAGSTSATVLDRLQVLFRESFDRTLEPITAGGLAAGAGADAASLLDVPGSSSSVAWSESQADSLDVLGNEFLVWLWHTLQNDGGTVGLADGSEVAATLAKTLLLDCPRGETGRDQLTDDTPTLLPEAFRALQAGKLPRKAGLLLARQGAQYELTLQAETLAVSGASLPKPEGSGLSPFEIRVSRLESVRHLAETLDLLFNAFLSRRISTGWTADLGRIHQWLRAA
jgi:hypothetical protein